MKTFSKNALIIGAGPAGLTAAYELLKSTDIKPVIVERLNVIGGHSATHRYKGNHIDVGGHRYFSHDQTIISWWNDILPLQQSRLTVDGSSRNHGDPDAFDSDNSQPPCTDAVLLIRNRLSRIYFKGRFFHYPLKPSFDTVYKLGPVLSILIGWDYFINRMSRHSSVKNLEEFFINRFGKKLYEIFFRDYTEKVWGVPCRNISSEWGRERIKSLSLSKMLQNMILHPKKTKTEASLISQFYYPKLGVGQMWEETARRIVAAGGEIYTDTVLRELHVEKYRVRKVVTESQGRERIFTPDYVFSSAPLKDLIAMIRPGAPEEVREVSENLPYRDFIMTGILARTMCQGTPVPRFPQVRLLPDTWIYIQEPAIKAGRLQIYNNWSPYMLAFPDTVWLGLEFFCNENDFLWSKTDQEMIRLASDELNAMNLVSASDIIDGVCIRSKKAYPAYWGSYFKLELVKKYLCGFSNLFCIGRNGLHRYNNMDHSMLTAMLSVNALRKGLPAQESIWDTEAVNIDD